MDVYEERLRIGKKLSVVILTRGEDRINEHEALLTKAVSLLVDGAEREERDRQTIERIKRLVEGEVR